MTPDKQQLLDSVKQALQSLFDARNCLNDAKSLGVWDMFGGGFITSMIKNDRIKDVDEHLAVAQDKLQLLLNKLEVWPEKIYLRNSVSENQQFMDIVFDNIFTDSFVQEKINAAGKQIDEIIYQVENLIAILKN